MQPLVCLKAQGLQVPKRWATEPSVGHSGEPTWGSGSDSAILTTSGACGARGGDAGGDTAAASCRGSVDWAGGGTAAASCRRCAGCASQM